MREAWESYAGLDLFEPCDFVPFSDQVVAAIFVFIIVVPLGLGVTLFCESRPNGDYHGKTAETVSLDSSRTV